MPVTQQLDLNGVATWTNNTGADVYVVSGEATGPGQDGQGASTILGVGGDGVGWTNPPIDGRGGDAGADGNEGVAYINGSPVGTGDHAVGEGDVIEIVGGGGYGSGTAGGASGGALQFIVPGDFSGDVTIEVGGVAADTTITRSPGPVTALASAGGSASGDTTGSPGSNSAGSEWDTWINQSSEGQAGTGPSNTSGPGGNAGNWGAVSFSEPVLVAREDSITLNTNSNVTVTGMSLVSSSLNLLAVFYRGAGDPVSDIFSGEITLFTSGGQGADPASGDPSQGGGGGGAATANGDGTDGDNNLGGTDGDGNVSGGNGGTSGGPGGDGATAGGGGGGDTIAGWGTGKGIPGRASFTYIQPPAFTSSPNFNVVENTTVIGTVAATSPDESAISYSISGGDDQAKFSINASTGLLSFLAPHDYEAPNDTNTNNVYEVQVQATNDDGATIQNISVTVTNADESAPGGDASIAGAAWSLQHFPPRPTSLDLP